MCQGGVRGWNHFAFMWIVFTFVQLFSLMWEPAQLCAGNGVLFYMCGAVEVAWLVQNIRHGSASV